MSRTIAFLRAINVGGHTVKMDALRAHFEALGLAEVETFIASGNVIFRTEDASAGLADRIAAHLEAQLGYPVATFLRSDAEVARIAATQPFPEAEFAAAQAFNVGLLSAPLAPEAEAAVLGLATEIDAFRIVGREVYWLCRVRQSESTFTNVRFERLTRVAATWRNRNTYTRLADKYPG